MFLAICTCKAKGSVSKHRESRCHKVKLKTEGKKNDTVCKLRKIEGFFKITSKIGEIRTMKSGLIPTAAESTGHLYDYIVFKVTVVKCKVPLDPLAPGNQIDEGMQTVSKSSILHFPNYLWRGNQHNLSMETVENSHTNMH